MATRKIEVAITGDASSLERAFRRSGAAADSFGSRMGGRVAKGMKTAGIIAGGALAAGVGLAAVGLVKAGQAAAEAEASNARLSAQLKTLGKNNVAVKANIDKTVQSLSMMSGFDDEDLQDSFTTLLRTTGSVKKAQSELGMVADIARGKQISLASAANILNRVNAGNVGSLKKLGIEVDKNTTKEQALAMLRAKFAGQASAYGKTAAGAQERLRVGMENAFEQIGVALTPLITTFADFATNQLPGIAKAISIYLGQAIAWLKANWPEIKAVLQSVWSWYQTYVQSVVVPVFKGIATAIGTMIGFIREHMPEIRAAAQAVFGWIQTNIVPTVRAIATAVGVSIAFMTGFWKQHANDIKTVLAPAFNAIKTVITSALTIIKSTIEFWLALFRLDFDKAGEAIKSIIRAAFSALAAIALVQLKTLAALAGIAMREVWERVKAAGSDLGGWATKKVDDLKTSIVQGISDTATRVYEGAKEIPRKIGQGITSAIGDALGPAKDLAQKISDMFPGSEPKDASSPLRGLERRGRALVRNFGIGVAAAAPSFTMTVTDTMRGAIQSALDTVQSLTGSLGGMLGRIFETTSPEGKRLAEIRKQQKKQNDVRRRAELQAAIDSASTDEDRAKAQQDLSDYLLEYEAQGLEDAITERKDKYDEDIANLTASFRAGRISAETFKTELNNIIGGATGAELGSAFADQFSQTVSAIGPTIDSIVAAIGKIGAAISQFPGVTGANPAGAVGGEQDQQKNDAADKWNKWKQARDAKLAALRKAARGANTRGGSDITPSEQFGINLEMEKWDKNHPQPPKPMATGGIVMRPLLLGEAGPEAVLPLSSGRAQDMLASAISRSGGANTGAGTTVINVTVSGNEFSARDFARKLQPELNRIVGFGQV